MKQIFKIEDPRIDIEHRQVLTVESDLETEEVNETKVWLTIHHDEDVAFDYKPAKIQVYLSDLMHALGSCSKYKR